MDRRRHDVAAVQHVFHHHGMQAGRVAAGALVPARDLLVHRGQQGAGTAGEVADAQPADRRGVGPVHAVQLGDGQPCQQRRGFGAGVERGEILAVGNQPLKQAAGQVVRDDGAGRGDALRGFAQDVQDAGRGVRRKLFHEVARNRENGPVIDVQNVSPCVGHGPLRVGDGRAAHPVQRLDGRVAAGQPLVKQQGVGHDGARHAAGLDVVGHAEQAGDVQRDAGPRRRHVVQQGDAAVDAFFQRLGRGGDGALRHGDEADQIGQIRHVAVQPARGRKPLHVLPVLRQHAVGQAGRGDDGPQVLGIAEVRRVAERHRGLDGVGFVHHAEAEAGRGFGLRGARRQVFGFDDDRCPVRGRHRDVESQARPVGDEPRLFRVYRAARQHPLEQVGQRAVGVRFGMAGASVGHRLFMGSTYKRILTVIGPSVESEGRGDIGVRFDLSTWFDKLTNRAQGTAGSTN